jgi:hypothetical protein
VVTGRARLEDLGLPMPGLFWVFFLFFFISLLLFVSDLAGVIIGATTNVVAYMASVKSLVANLLMLLSCQGNPRAETH